MDAFLGVAVVVMLFESYRLGIARGRIRDRDEYTDA